MSETEQTVLVTGGTGFLGAELVRALAAAGYRVRVFSRTAPADAAGTNVEWVRGTVLDATGLRDAASGASVIFHLAGSVVHSRRDGYRTLRELHVTGTANTVEAARTVGARRVIAASTSGAVGVGASPDFVAGDDAAHATSVVRRWPYYLTKIEAEHALFDRGAALDVDVVAMRPSLLLGPGDRRLSSTRVVADFAARRIPVVPRGGTSVIDVRDAAAAFVAAMEHPRPARSYLLGSENLTFSDLFGRLGAISGIRGPRLSPPNAVTRFGAALMRPFRADPSLDPVVVEMAAHYWYIDAARARADLGFAPRPVETTLADTLNDLSDGPES